MEPISAGLSSLTIPLGTRFDTAIYVAKGDPHLGYRENSVIGGLRYGDGTLYTRNAGDVRVFWEGPSFGFDFGAEGARTMMLVYSLPQTEAIFNRFGGINGSAYLVGGFGLTALSRSDIVVVPIRSGVGLRLGANLGWVKFTDSPTWNPF